MWAIAYGSSMIAFPGRFTDEGLLFCIRSNLEFEILGWRPFCLSMFQLKKHEKHLPFLIRSHHSEKNKIWFLLCLLHVIPVILCEAKLSAGNIINPHDSPNIQMKHNAIYFSKLKSPFSSNSQDLSALCPVESVLVPYSPRMISVHAVRDETITRWPDISELFSMWRWHAIFLWILLIITVMVTYSASGDVTVILKCKGNLSISNNISVFHCILCY